LVAAVPAVPAFIALTLNSAAPEESFPTKTLPAFHALLPVDVLAVNAAFDAW